MLRFTKQYRFSAAHRYWNDEWTEKKNIEIFQDDVKLHGHNYQLDITVSGPIDDNSGFIINIKDLNALVNAHIIKIFDHSRIEEDIPWFLNNLILLCKFSLSVITKPASPRAFKFLRG